MFLAGTLMAQNRFSCVVEDTATHEKLPSVSAIIPSLNKSAVSDSNGRINFNSLPSGALLINFSFVGYEQMSITIRIPQDNGIIISLKKRRPGGGDYCNGFAYQQPYRGSSYQGGSAGK